MHLECGHYGEREAVFKPRNGEHWCDVEGIFSPIKPKETTAQKYPEEVPF